MKKIVLLAIVLLFVSCAPQIAQAPRDAVTYAANIADLRTYFINEMPSQPAPSGYKAWRWDAATVSVTRFIAVKDFGAVDWVLTVFTLGIWLVTDKPLVMDCQVVGENQKVSVLCSPANAFVFDFLDKKFPRAQ